ncbi:MAG: glycosyltransferase family 2 protein, partial [Thalassobaculaceae bacterium]
PANGDAALDLAACLRLARAPAEGDLLRWTLAGHPATFDALVRLGQIEEARGQAAIAADLTLRALDMAPDLDSLAHRLRRLRADPAAAALIGGRDVTPHYQRWIAAHQELSAAARAAKLDGLARRPRISVILPVHDPAPDLLAAAIASVRDQSYPDWQLCICDDASRDPAVIALLDRAAADDPRVTLTRRRENGHISRASNDALAKADGAYVTFLDHDDMLAADALLWVAAAIDEHPNAQLLYSDEDKIDELGERFAPHFKPDWSPDLILGQNYVCHLAVYRRDLVAAVGGLRPGYEGSQDHDLVLRVSARLTPAEIHHIPRVLYHWRAAVGSTAFELTAKPYSLLAGQRVVADHLAVHAPGAEVAVRHNRLRLTWPLPDPAPKVTVIVPTRDQAAMTEQCLRAVLRDTAYPD